MNNKNFRAGQDRFSFPLEPANESPDLEPETIPTWPEDEPALPEGPAPPPEEPILQPPRPAERRAQEFLPQWLKRQGRVWPG